MRVTIHRVWVTLYSPNHAPFEVWKEFSFEPSAEQPAQDRGTGFRLVRHASRPVEIEAPVGSELFEWRGRTLLRTHFNPYGLDSTSIWHMADKHERGFSLVDDAQVLAPVQPAAPPEEKPPVWGIVFRSCYLPHCASFLSDYTVTLKAPIRSTLDLDRAAKFNSLAWAMMQLSQLGLSPDTPIPLGTGFLFPAAADLSAVSTDGGIVFELPGRVVRAPADPAPIRPATPKAKASQIAFAFAEGGAS